MTSPSVDPTEFPHTVEGYRQAWAVIEQAWAATTQRALELPPEELTSRVNGEWSFLETLRHLVFATDSWVRRTILSERDAYYSGGLPHDEAVTEDGIDVRTWGIDPAAAPTLDEVLSIREARWADVRGVLGSLHDEDLMRICDPNPSPGNPQDTRVPVRACLDVTINEEWSHRGYMLRDHPGLSR
jgi:uncharacterized damage-inducible protein DinB